MTAEGLGKLRRLEGRRVDVALRDGSRIDDCQLVSCGRNRLGSLWLFNNGNDNFVALDDIVEVTRQFGANRGALHERSSIGCGASGCAG